MIVIGSLSVVKGVAGGGTEKGFGRGDKGQGDHGENDGSVKSLECFEFGKTDELAQFRGDRDERDLPAGVGHKPGSQDDSDERGRNKGQFLRLELLPYDDGGKCQEPHHGGQVVGRVVGRYKTFLDGFRNAQEIGETPASGLVVDHHMELATED